ncbi:pseudouridine synthase [Shewanella sp. NFH-SH190041]|uniref:RNA pseudouridine synthase n=1 Tax=Shewanella sp. NFH-SH190041 TaxID=2950245 RepID=UPI0021C3A160|nr:pseudouridine synthase [Shewanella sp. NFH-SH190041]BDM63260.1 pseudouridine synthase [Shewanella sp. NFH-SH190041]
MRLAQYLALCGICSRKQAQRLISSGRISLDGRLANHTDKVHFLAGLDHPAKEALYLDGNLIPGPEPKTYLLFHKPVGIDCRLLPDDPASLYHLLPNCPRLYPVGRLDKDSRGLLLLTNDGELTQRLMHPGFGHSKDYHVTLARPYSDEFIRNMCLGVSYRDVTTLPCDCRRLTEDRFAITLTQGMNRQIRRMSQALGHHVIDLKRVALMNLTLHHGCGRPLAAGEMRPLTPDELAALQCATGLAAQA